MMKISVMLFIFLASLVLAQSNYQVVINKSNNNIVMNPHYSPDGTQIAYTTSGYKGIWVYNISSKKIKQLTDEDAAGFGFKWSSDSKSILCRVAKYEETKRFNAVKIFSIENDKSLQLTEFSTSMPYLPYWSDGDTKVILPRNTTNEIYISGELRKSPSSSNEIDAYCKGDKIIIREVLNNVEKIIEPIKDSQILDFALSPVKDKIVFKVMGGNLYSINIDGTNLTDLGSGSSPCWSSNNQQIIYMITGDDGHNYKASDIYTINADGSQKKNLTNTTDIIEMNPCISPDGKSIVFDVYDDGSIYSMDIY